MVSRQCGSYMPVGGSMALILKPVANYVHRTKTWLAIFFFLVVKSG